jgi:uncharacterized membrane protein
MFKSWARANDSVCRERRVRRDTRPFATLALLPSQYDMPRLIYILISSALLLQFALLEGCASGSQASKQAGKGAAVGAVGGAVAGGLSSILFGGSVARGVATGAAIGAATGAATGAVSGGMADSEAKQAAAPTKSPAPGTVDLGDLQQKLGPKNLKRLRRLHSAVIRTRFQQLRRPMVRRRT